MGNDQKVEGLQKTIAARDTEIAELKTENTSLTKTQQELKAKIKELTELPPKMISGHKLGKIKYIRQERK